MNFKERLNLNTKNNEYNSIEVEIEAYSTDTFVRENEAEKHLRNIFIKERNVILLTRKDYKKNDIYCYIKKFIGKNKNVEVIEDINNGIADSIANKIIIPNPTIDEVVKILELTLTESKNFIFSLDVKSYKNVVESLKTIILLNYQNLTNRNVEHLIGSSQPYLVYIGKNNDEKYTISNIREVEYKEGKIVINNIYSKTKKEVEKLDEQGILAEIKDYEIKTKNEVTKEKSEQTIIENKENNENKIEQVVEIEPVEQEKEEIKIEIGKEKEVLVDTDPTKTAVIEEKKSINKYKQLKEKLKQKKIQSQQN